MPHSISSVTQNADALSAVWSSGEQTDLPYLWLRDNCAVAASAGSCRLPRNASTSSGSPAT